MALRLIGTATTDVNGNAVLEDGYTGTGAGLVDIIAQTTIDESTVVSTPYEVLDSLMYDTGITGTANETDWFLQTGTTKTIGSDGTTLTGDSNGLWAWINKAGTSHSSQSDISEWTGDLTIEFDVLEVDNCYFSFYEAYPSTSQQNMKLVVGHNKIVKKGDVFNHYVNNRLVLGAMKTLAEPLRIGFKGTQNTSLKFKELKVYSDEENISALFYDDGVSETASWNKSNADMTVINNQYTEITKTGTSNASCIAWATMTAPFIVEWHNHTVTDSGCYFMLSGNNFFALSNRSITGDCTVKLVVEADKITPIVNGETKNTVTVNLDFSQSVYVTLRVSSASTKTIGFSDFKIYPM